MKSKKVHTSNYNDSTGKLCTFYCGWNMSVLKMFAGRMENGKHGKTNRGKKHKIKPTQPITARGDRNMASRS